MLPPIFAHLKAAAAVTAIIGNPPRVYSHGRAPQGAVAPYVVWTTVGDEPQNNLSDVPASDRWTVQVDCYHGDGSQVSVLAKAVRDALEPYAHMMGVVVDERETATNLYRIALQFDYWLSR